MAPAYLRSPQTSVQRPKSSSADVAFLATTEKLLALAGLVWLWFGLSAAAHAQFLVIGDDNKLYWDDTGKMVFTEPGKDDVVIVDIKDPEAPKIVASLPLMNTVIGPADQPRDHA